VYNGNTSDTCSGGSSMCDTQNTTPVQVTHTYASAGTYNAKVVSSVGYQCATNPANCLSATTTVVVTNATSQYLTASPSSGAAPLTVSFSSSAGYQSYPAGVYLNFGDSSAPYLVCSSGASCGPVASSHVYANNGTYSATLVGFGASTSTVIATS